MAKKRLMCTAHFLTVLGLLSLAGAEGSWALPAFPGAEGMGASAKGARGASGGPTVRFVTNLNDSGSGSLRDALQGSREGSYVVFQTSGIIHLSTDITITSNYITVAGETSPGGTVLEGGGLVIGSASTTVHDIVIRHLRVRPGTAHYDGDGGNIAQHALAIWRSYNVIIDHCSFSWGADEVTTATTYGGTPVSFYDVTFSNCFIAEGLVSAPGGEPGGHAFAMFFNALGANQSRVSVHDSVFAHFQNRIPRAYGNILVDWRSNVVYNWEKFWSATYLDMATRQVVANHVGNWAKPGPNSNTCYPTYRSGDAVIIDEGQGDFCNEAGAKPMLYASGNAGCVSEGSKGTGGWGVVCGNTGGSRLADETWRAAVPFPTTDIPVTTRTMNSEQFAAVLAGAGATKPVRDEVDTRVAAEIVNGTGGLRSDANYDVTPSLWGGFSTPTPPADTDRDGMADSWEVVTWGNLSKAAAGDADADGYQNIEEYFHYLVGSAAADTTSPAPPAGLRFQ